MLWIQFVFSWRSENLATLHSGDIIPTLRIQKVIANAARDGYSLLSAYCSSYQPPTTSNWWEEGHRLQEFLQCFFSMQFSGRIWIVLKRNKSFLFFPIMQGQLALYFLREEFAMRAAMRRSQICQTFCPSSSVSANTEKLDKPYSYQVSEPISFALRSMR